MKTTKKADENPDTEKEGMKQNDTKTEVSINALPSAQRHSEMSGKRLYLVRATEKNSQWLNHQWLKREGTEITPLELELLKEGILRLSLDFITNEEQKTLLKKLSVLSEGSSAEESSLEGIK